MQENKIIREKLEGLQGLPAGYQPSLESKWALIEAGLDEKKKGSVSPWMWVAAAAVVLVFFTSRWIFSGDQVSNAKHYSASTGETVHEKKTVFPLAVLDFPATVKKNVPVHGSIIREDIPVAMVQRDTLMEENLPEQRITEQEPLQEPVATQNTKKKPRFVELDFSDGIAPGTTYSEPATASHTLKFKLGIGQTQSTTVQNNPKRFVGLRQPL